MSESGQVNKELPPVGSYVEFGEFNTDLYPASEWEEGDELEVLAHREVGIGVIAIVFNNRTRTATGIIGKYYRAIRTKEQIEAEEREKAIEEMIKVDYRGTLSRRVFCGMLYDSGYRKQGEAK